MIVDSRACEEGSQLLHQRFSDLEASTMDPEKRSRFFEKLIRSLPGIFYIFDEHLRFLGWNKNLETVSGYTGEEVRTRRVPDMFQGESRAQIERGIRESFASGESLVEAEVATKDGRSVPYAFTGVCARIDDKSYILGMGTDLSELKQTESALRESEALYRMLAERMTVGVILYDRSQVLFANNALASMFGFQNARELLGREIDNVPFEGFERSLLRLFQVLDQDDSKEKFFETCWLTRAGREIWIEAQASLIRWKQLPTILLTARDKTEAKLREISMQEEAEHLRRENLNLRSSIKDRFRLGNIIGKSPLMQDVYELILNSTRLSANVIIYGESGTGKELVARAIHEMSKRSAGPFVPVNCAALPEHLLESEFFGHKKGAFTDARAEKPGYLDVANKGTLFLDEVAELSLSVQAKLLRAIEGGGYTPVGSTSTKHSDFRIIAATHRDLLDLVRKGRFREDFFYRIHVIPLALPPLRQRKEDIPLLVEHFLKSFSEEGKVAPLPAHVMEAFLHHGWPGNVRELQNAVQRYLAFKRVEFIPGALAAEGAGPGRNTARTEAPLLAQSVRNAEADAIRKALEECRGRKVSAAKRLGIHRKTLFRKMKQYDLS
ncbi:MAG: sigma-54-dependent Fis family transcriptional regulator [bacterium]